MIPRALATTWHTAHIILLMLFRPVALFARINSLPWYQDTLRQWALSAIGSEPAIVLEAGCATGELAQFLAIKGHHVTGVDSSPAMLARANTSRTSTALLMQGSVMQLPFEAGLFQHVLAASLLNVVDDPVIALREMARVCQAGGVVSALVPQAGISRRSVAELADELLLSGFSRIALMFWLRMARKLSIQTLEEYFRDAGLENIKSQPYLNGMVIAVTGTFKPASVHPRCRLPA